MTRGNELVDGLLAARSKDAGVCKFDCPQVLFVVNGCATDRDGANLIEVAGRLNHLCQASEKFGVDWFAEVRQFGAIALALARNFRPTLALNASEF